MGLLPEQELSHGFGAVSWGLDGGGREILAEFLQLRVEMRSFRGLDYSPAAASRTRTPFRASVAQAARRHADHRAMRSNDTLRLPVISDIRGVLVSSFCEIAQYGIAAYAETHYVGLQQQITIGSGEHSSNSFPCSLYK